MTRLVQLHEKMARFYNLAHNSTYGVGCDLPVSVRQPCSTVSSTEGLEMPYDPVCSPTNPGDLWDNPVPHNYIHRKGRMTKARQKSVRTAVWHNTPQQMRPTTSARRLTSPATVSPTSRPSQTQDDNDPEYFHCCRPMKAQVRTQSLLVLKPDAACSTTHYTIGPKTIQA